MRTDFLRRRDSRSAGAASCTACLAAFALCAALPGTASPSPSRNPTPAAAGAGPAFSQYVSEVLGLLERRNLLPRLSPEKRRSLINDLLQRLDCDAEITAPAQGLPRSGSPPAAPRRAQQPQAQVVGGWFDYLRIPAVNRTAVQLAQATAETAREGHFEGAVVDLRHAGGDSAENARRFSAALEKTRLPLAILIDSETNGAAEIAAARFQHCRHAVLIGKPTRGRPFARTPRRLASGDILLVPATGKHGLRPAHPVQPDVFVARGLDARLLRDPDRPPRPAADPAVARALDLLNAIRIFSEKPVFAQAPQKNGRKPAPTPHSGNGAPAPADSAK